MMEHRTSTIGINYDLPLSVFVSKEQASIAVAQRIAEVIRMKQANRQLAVIGLATGATPLLVYKELIRMHQEEALSFHNVVTFNLDEYYPMEPNAPRSYSRYMNTHLFDYIDIKRSNIHIPNGTLKEHEIDVYCDAYEQQIADVGGIDFQLLGIGRTGHIGFNEPGSSPDSLTRLVQLDELTRKDGTVDFGGFENVPKYAITMGIGTILKAREIVLLAWGVRKSQIIKETIENRANAEIPASYLHLSDHAYIVSDTDAASKLDAQAILKAQHPNGSLVRGLPSALESRKDSPRRFQSRS